MISLSYSRISLKDVCLKLQLDSEEDAEYIVAKVGGWEEIGSDGDEFFYISMRRKIISPKSAHIVSVFTIPLLLLLNFILLTHPLFICIGYS